jgi:hypothetical protein
MAIEDHYRYPNTPRKRLTKCIFCGYEGELTGEHIIPRRYRHLLPRTMRTHERLHSIEYGDRSIFKVDRRTHDPLDWKVRCVCESNCNNGWMRRLEDAAEPIIAPLITGCRMRLNQSQQEIAATWSIMKTIVAEFEDPDQITTHHMQRKRLFTSRRPPEEGWVVWMGHYPNPPSAPSYFHYPFQYLDEKILAKRNDPRATYFNASITTQIIGKLFIQVGHAPKKFGITRWRFPHLPDGGFLYRTWPKTSYSIAWPPIQLTRRDAGIATRAFRDNISRNVRKRNPSINTIGPDG